MSGIGATSVSECPCEIALRYIGGAWKVLIVWRLVHCGNPALKSKPAGGPPKLDFGLSGAVL